MKRILSFILVCVVLITGIMPVMADYTGPMPEARIYTVSTGEGTTELQAGNATASHTISCTGTLGTDGWCNDDELITINGKEPKPGNYLNGAELDDGNDIQSIHNQQPPYEFTYRREGETTAYYWVRSTVGDTSEMNEALFKIDKSEPDAACLIETEPSYENWYKGTVVINGQSTDSVSFVQKQVFNAGNKTMNGFISLNNTVVDLPVTLVATDAAGNSKTTECVRINIDNTKPVIDSYTQFANGDLFSSPVTFSMKAHDEHSGLSSMAIVIDGVEYEAGESGTIIIELENGNHTVVFKAVDNVENIQQTQPLTFYVDAQAPTVTIDTPYTNGVANLVTYGTEITGKANDNGVGFGKILAKFPGSSAFQEVVFSRGTKSKYAESGIWSADLPGTGLKSGDEMISVKATDAFGNESEETSVEVLIDVDKPEPSFEISGTEGKNNWYTGAVTIKGTSEDAHSGIMTETVSYAGQEGSGSKSKSVTIPATQNGVFTITVDASDYANNTKKISGRKVNVDNTKPVIDSYSVNGNSEFKDGDLFGPTVKFVVSGSDAHSGIDKLSFIIDGTEYTADANGSFELEMEHGNHTVVFKVIDNVGLSEQTSARTFFVDAKAPTATINTPVMNGIDNLVTHNSEISGTVTDAGGGFGTILISYPGSDGFEPAEYKQLGKTQYSENGNWTIKLPESGLTSGEATISIKAEDIFNNESEPVEITVLVDVDKPKPSYEASGSTGKTGWYTGKVELTGTSTDGHSGVMKQTVGYTGPEEGSAENKVIIPESLNGIFSVTVTAVDYANNSDTSTEDNAIRLDNKAPVIVSNTIPSSEDWFGSEMLFEMESNDEHSGIQYVAVIVDGKEYRSETPSYQYKAVFTSTGKHTVQYKAVDNVEIETVSETYEFQVDVTKPIVTIDIPELNGKDYLINIDSEISGLGTDEGSGIKSVSVLLPGSNDWSDVTLNGHPNSLTWKTLLSNKDNLKSGDVTVKAKAVDNVGNESDITEITMMLDFDDPQIDYSIEGTKTEDWYSGEVTIVNKSSDTHSDLLETKVTVDCTPKKTVTGSDNAKLNGNYSGKCSITVYAKDYAGNEAEKTDKDAISIDNEKPSMSEFSLSKEETYYPATGDVCILDAEDRYSGLSNAYVYFDDGTEFSEPVTENGSACIAYRLNEGRFNAQFMLKDKAGNESELSESFPMIIDNMGPRIYFTTAPDIYKPSEKTITYIGRAFDVASGVSELKYSIDGGETFEELEFDAEGNFKIDVEPITRMTVIVSAVDTVGNESSIETAPLQRGSDASSRMVITPSTVANMVIKPSIIDYDGNTIYDFSSIKSARAFVYGRGYDHAEIELDAKNNYAFMWDGTFPTNVKAPRGWYWLTIEFTDILDNIECYNSRIWVEGDEAPVVDTTPQYKTFDISGTVTAIDNVSVTVNGSRYLLADFSKMGSGIKQGSQVMGKGRSYVKENVNVVEKLDVVPAKQVPFNGLIDDLGKDYVIIDGQALVIDNQTKFYCTDTRVGDYVSGLYIKDTQNRMYVTEFGPLSCERDIITRQDSGIVK